MSARVQNWIHFIEEGAGARTLRIAVLVLLFIALAVLYNVGSFRNFNTEEAMDLSQLARNISVGEGYTTDYVRPVSITLIESHTNKKLAKIQTRLAGSELSTTQKTALGKKADHLRKMAMLKVAHPDLANAPAYPVLLAGLMKVAPMEYKISKKKIFTTYAPELWIAVLNQALFLLAAGVVYKIAKQLFDQPTALMATVLFSATELFWRFSIGGLPTMLLVLIFVCLSWCLLKFLHADELPLRPGIWFWVALAGALVGVGCLTRYSFGWLILPVLIFLFLFSSADRLKFCLVALAAFVLVISPWLARNHSLSGNLFGTAAYALCEETPAFQEGKLERTLGGGSPFKKVSISDYARKFMETSRNLFTNELPRIGGSWLMPFFIVGLLIPLQTNKQYRLRAFLLLALASLFLAQAMGRSHLTSENLLVLAAPILFIFGVGVYFALLRRIKFPEPVFAHVVTLSFTAAISAPLLFTLLPPGSNPGAYPPYFPPVLQESSAWMRKNELVMSDIPWAVAWYGDRQSVPLSLNYPDDFLKLNDYIKPVQALYLTPKTTDSRFVSQMIRDRQGWGRFVLENISRGNVPPGFPLQKAPAGFLPDQLFLTDWERWTFQPK